MRVAIVVTTLVLAAGAACGGGVPHPAALDTRNDGCGLCRMTVSDRRLAAQIVAPGDEPRFFDDLGCLATFLSDRRPPDDAVVYVADHRTGEWTPAALAVFSRLSRPSTPMASGLVAHATAASRQQDAGAAGSTPVPSDLVLGRASFAARQHP